MKIRSITLKGFGMFDKGFNITFDNPSNINIVVGRNESGKSTVAESIFGILFGFPLVTDQEKYQPWKSGDYWGALHLTNGVDEYRIERDFHRHHVRVRQIDQLSNHEKLLFDGQVSPRGKITEDKRQYLNLMQDFFGFSDPAIFKATIFIHQNDIVTLNDDETAGKIRQYISGSLETDYEKVLASLLEQYFVLTKANPWGRDKIKKRRLDELEFKIQDLKDKAVHVQESLEKSLRIEKEKDDLTRKLKTARDELEKYQTIITKVTEYRDLESSVANLQESYNQYEMDLNTVNSMGKKIAQLNDEYSEVQFMEKLPDDFPARLAELDSLNENLRDMEERLAGEQRHLDKHPRRHITFVNSIAIVSMLIISTASLFTGNLIFYVIAIAISVVGAAATITWAVWRKSVSNEIRQQISGRIQVFNEDLETKKKQHRKIHDTLSETFPDGKLGDREKLKKNFGMFQQLGQQRRETSIILNKLPDLPSLTSRFERVKSELDKKVKLLERAKANASYVESFTPVEEEQYRRNIEVLEQQIRDQDIKLKTVEQAYWSMGTTDANIHVIEDELEELEEERIKLRRRADAVYLALATLMSAQAKYNDSYMERFCEVISERFAKMTGNLYVTVDLAEDTMEVMVSNQDNERIPVSSLSAGAQDQLFFAMRLAMIRYLTTDRSLPIIIDDSFVNFDAGRLAATRIMLEEIAKDNQIILFTHDRKYLDWQVPAFDFEHAG
ncbi:ATP-binding protein [Planctomycetota bacterium]